jgi:hypothetical protein
MTVRPCKSRTASCGTVGQRRRLFRRVDPTVAAFALFASLNARDGRYDRRGRLGREALVAHVERLYLTGLAAPIIRRTGTRAARPFAPSHPRRP